MSFVNFLLVDLIVSILIAELVAISIENHSEPIYLTIVPIVVLVLLEILLAYISIKSRSLRIILEGKPSLIISNGKINYHEMVKQRYTLDDLLISLRQKEIRDITEVEFAFLEPNGKLSIFKYKPLKIKSIYPMPIILDGKIDEDSLKNIKKDKIWLNKNRKVNCSNCKPYVIYEYVYNTLPLNERFELESFHTIPPDVIHIDPPIETPPTDTPPIVMLKI